MLEHTFREIALQNGSITKIKLTVNIADPGYELLGIFLNTEIKNFGNEITEEIKAVLENKKICGDFNGNRCRLTIDKDISRLYDLYAGDSSINECVVDTNELAFLVSEYIDRMNALNCCRS